MYINKSTLFGTLLDNPILKETEGHKVLEIDIETTKVIRGKHNEKIEVKKSFPLLAQGTTAEIIASNLKKGSLLYVEGELDLEGDPYITIKTFQFGPKMKMVGQEII